VVLAVGKGDAAMKIALLGTGFGQAHAAVYQQRDDVDEVVVFGRTPDKLAKISEQFGFATTTDLDTVIADASVDLVDICLPTGLHAEVRSAPCRPAETCSSSCRSRPPWSRRSG
jgi:predicted dehydrogenase